MPSPEAQIEETRSYKSIFKATTLFGGVQAYQILILIIKSKFIAVLLGTVGIGIQGLYTSAIQFIQSISSLSLSQSAVRDVSEANGSGDVDKIGRTVSALRRIIWITGTLGMIVVIFLSPILSKASFGNYDYTIPFILLSVILLLDQLAAGQKVVLQGMRKLKELAKASAIGATLGLLISVPFYYALGIKGIVPTLILNSVSTLIISWLFARKIHIPKPVISMKETWDRGKVMVRMGVAMSISGILSTAIAYFLRSYIMHLGGTESVGLFQAGFVIINTYVGLVFTAMGTDYYPRLAAANNDNQACRRIVSQQGEIATQIIAPLLCICILLMPFIIRLLYSEQFADAVPFVLWCCPGMMFRMASWLVAYQFVAKAESRLFIITEAIGGVVYLSLSLLGYRLGGLTGMGIAFSINYLLYFSLVFFIAVRKYHFSFSIGFIKSFICQFALVAGTLAVLLLIKTTGKYWLSTFLTVLSCTIALFVLVRKMGLTRGL